MAPEDPVSEDNGAASDDFLLRVLYRLKTAIYAAPKKDEDAPQLRVGLIGGDIPVFPPLAFMLLSGTGLLSWYFSGNRMRFLPRTLASSISFRSCLGIAMTTCAGKLVSTCQKELVKSGTEANFQPVVKVCDTGPYRYGRNFMYVSVVMLPIAGSIALDTAWVLYSALGLGMYLNFVVIPAEENLLRTEFGKTYEDYCSRVPRWFWIF